MRTKLLSILLIACCCIFIHSCKEQPKPIEAGVWYGSIIRDKDNQHFGPIAFFFHGDTLEVYSNYITGDNVVYIWDKEYKQDEQQAEENTKYYLYNLAKKDINRRIENCSFFFAVKDNHLELKNFKEIKNLRRDSLAAVNFRDNGFLNKPATRHISYYIRGTYGGMMSVKSNNTPLGNIKMYAYEDSLRIYSNILFGKENKVAYRTQFTEKGAIYKTEQFSFELAPQGVEYITLEKNGFRVVLNKDYNCDEKYFFENRTAWKNPDFYYLIGKTYRGHINMSGNARNAMATAFTSYDLEIYFENSHTCRYKVIVNTNYDNLMSAMVSLMMSTSDITKEYVHEYTISDNGMIHYTDCIGGVEDLKITNHGRTLVLDFPEEGFSGTLTEQ